MANQSVREKDVQIIPVPLFPHFNFSCLCKEIFFKYMLRRGSVGSASACCKAGPSSILGSAPHGGSSLAERRSDEDTGRKASANDEG